MKLYSHQISPLTRLCQIVADIAGQDIEIQWIDLMNKEQKQDWFREVTPKQQVPALEIKKGKVLTESIVISKYFCRLSGNISIYPSDPLIQAEIDEAIEDAKAMKWVYFPRVRFGTISASAQGLAEVEESMKTLVDLRFKNGNTFLVGDSITLADIVLAVNLSMAIIVGEYDVQAKYPELMKGYNQVNKMTQWQRVEKIMIEYLNQK